MTEDAPASDGAHKSSNTASDYGRGAALLTVGIGVTGLVTFAYLSLASHKLSTAEYGQISLLWSAVFLITPIVYRPIEQLLARTIAERHARDQAIGQPLRVAALIQLGLGLVFAAIALSLKNRLVNHLFHGNETLYWIMFASVLAYAVSYFGRGLLAGNQRFGLYGLLVLIESLVRFMFPVAVVLGIASGQNLIALGILAGPVASLFVVPLALFGRHRAVQAASDARSAEEIADSVIEEEALLDAASGSSAIEGAEFTLAQGGGFALAALVIMASEQTILNAAPFIANNSAGRTAAAYVFNVLVIARAPMQLYQSVATSLLPHLSKLHADEDFKTYRHSVRVTLGAIAGFAGISSLVMAVIGPKLMEIVFGHQYVYGRLGLVAITIGMGIYLCGATLNQTALAAKRTGTAVFCWIGATAFFVVWMFLPFIASPLHRVEAGYPLASLVLFLSLFALYEVATPKSGKAPAAS